MARWLPIALASVIACAPSHESGPPPNPPGSAVVTPTLAAAPTKPVWVGMRPDHDTTRVLQVVRGAPAERAGVKLGDVVVSIAGQPVASGTEIIQRIRALPAGKGAAIVVRRNGSELTLTVVPEDRPAPDQLQASFVGKPAPALALVDAAGGPKLDLAELRGHVVVLEFWATWCGPCAITAPHLDDWQRQLAASGLRVVGISDEPVADVKAYVAEHKLGYTFVLDPEDAATAAYLIQGLPTIVVIDKGGVVRYSQIGVPDFDALEALIKQLL